MNVGDNVVEAHGHARAVEGAEGGWMIVSGVTSGGKSLALATGATAHQLRSWTTIDFGAGFWVSSLGSHSPLRHMNRCNGFKPKVY